MRATNTNTRAMTRAIQEHSASCEFTDWLKAGRAIVTERSVSGSVTVLPIARNQPDRWTQTQALEGINPFKQGLPEFFWQAYKAGMLSFEEARARSFTE